FEVSACLGFRYSDFEFDIGGVVRSGIKPGRRAAGDGKAFSVPFLLRRTSTDRSCFRFPSRSRIFQTTRPSTPEVKMRRISSKWTWWHKRAFPAICFGFLAVFSVVWILLVVQQQVPAGALLIPPALAAFGYLLMRWLVFPLMDEVWIENDHIV